MTFTFGLACYRQKTGISSASTRQFLLHERALTLISRIDGHRPTAGIHTYAANNRTRFYFTYSATFYYSVLAPDMALILRRGKGHELGAISTHALSQHLVTILTKSFLDDNTHTQ